LARREIVHIGVTSSPSAQYAGQCFVEAIADRDNENPRFMIRDRDSIYGKEFRRRVKSCGTRCLITPPRSPKAKAICERLNGTLRRDCLDHIIVIDDVVLCQKRIDENRRKSSGFAEVPRGLRRRGLGRVAIDRYSGQSASPSLAPRWAPQLLLP